MSYTVSRVWYGAAGYQSAWRYQSSTAGTLPAIVYFPGGGWKGAQREAWEVESIWTHGLNRTGGTYDGDYHVFVVHCAALGYTTQMITSNTPWSNATNYVVGDVRWHNGGSVERRYQCRQVNGPATSVVEPRVTSGWEDYWWEMGRGTRPWVDGTTYAVEAYVGNGSNWWQCIRAHTASAATDEPGAGTDWTEYWREVGPNEPLHNQLIDVVETTPGYLDQSITDAQTFMAWLKRNAATYSVDPDKIILAGSSAGGQRAGCAAYWYDLPWTGDSNPYQAREGTAQSNSRPAAVYLSITPVDLRLHTVSGLLPGLYGRDISDAQYVALPNSVKDSMSPMRVLKRTGLTVPTYMNYFGSRHDDSSTATIWSTNTYHHALNGWLLLQALTDDAPDGFAEDDGRHRLLESSATASSVDIYTDYNGTKTTTAYTTSSLTVADDFFAWAAARLGL